jgi:protein tyrosine/serine phosphatase
MSQRTVAFTNAFNFRDLGGYRAAGGRTVRWGQLFRADDLWRLDDGDLARLGELGVRTVVDLRRPVEVTNLGRIPPAAFTYLHAHVVHPEWPVATEFPSLKGRVEYLVDRYLEMAEAGGDGIGLALRTVADPAALPVVFHCVAGKDRTGLVAALTLSSLGVTDDGVADDYALSELAEEPNWTWYSARRADADLRRRWEAYTVAPREAMLAFLDALRERYGSVEKYLASIGVTGEHVESMREHLLTAS